MAVNKFFGGSRGIGERNEQNLLSNIIQESIQIYGVDLYYLPRTLGNFDKLFLEDSLSKFKNYYPIEAYLESFTGFAGTDALTKFGLQFNDSGTFVISRNRWQESVGLSKNVLLPDRPCEGDIVFFGLTNSYFEIMDVEWSDPYFQLSRNYVYKLKVELFQYSSESIETGNPDLDTIVFPFSRQDEEYYLLLDENSNIMTDENGIQIVSDEYSTDITDAQSDNQFIQRSNHNLIDFSVHNIFGEPDQE